MIYVYLVMCLAVALVGVAKGGFGGVGALVGAPIMSLVLPPVQVVGIMLPILLVIDAITARGYWSVFDRRTVMMAFPGALVGVIVGALMLATVNEHWIRITIGGFALAVAAQGLSKAQVVQRTSSAAPAVLFGSLSGFTSTVAHAGGPPIQLYLMHLGFAPRVFAGTSAILMASVNLMKIAPYAVLGQLNFTNASFSLALMPVAALAALFGIWLARHLPRHVFSITVNALMLIVGIKLVFDGAKGVLS